MIQSATAGDTKLELLTRIIVECARPRRVILFGSRARGEGREASDYDVYVEADESHPANELQSLIRKALREIELSADVIIGSKQRFDERRDDPGTVEWDVEREGVVLYSRPGVTAARVYERPPKAKSVAEWLERSAVDYRAVDRLASAATPDWEPICFHAHDAVEKLLKALIVGLERRPLHTHDLKDLLKQCPPELRANAAVRDALGVLGAVWPRSRYADKGPISRAEAEAAVAAAKLIRDVVRPLVRPA